MKKFFKMVCISTVIVIITLMTRKLMNRSYDMLKPLDRNMKWNIACKGLEGAVDFCHDEDGNLFIAYPGRIQIVDKQGKSYDLFKDGNLHITSIAYEKGKLYYASDSALCYYDVEKGTSRRLVDNLPNYGDYKESKVCVKGDFVYVSVGSATNSGVVGSDNKWLKAYPHSYDLTPKDIALKGLNFSENKTGAFVPYDTKNIEGQVIPGHYPGNASILCYNLKDGTSNTYAWGVRNVEGIDFTSSGKLLAIVGGMENRGLRAVKGDSDYIYEIKRNTWYGWPDFSGGDPITSPKFKDANNKGLDFIFAIHPNSNPPAPLYQHSSVSSLKGLAVDDKGTIGEKDSVYFYNEEDKTIWELNPKGILKGKIRMEDSSKVKNVRFSNQGLMVLDSNGCIYSIFDPQKSQNTSLNDNLLVYILFGLIAGIILILKLRDNK